MSRSDHVVNWNRAAQIAVGLVVLFAIVRWWYAR